MSKNGLREFILQFSDLCYDPHDCEVTVDPGTDANVEPNEKIRVRELDPSAPDFKALAVRLVEKANHRCSCHVSSCVRKVLRQEEFELGCNCGLEDLLAEARKIIGGGEE